MIQYEINGCEVKIHSSPGNCETHNQLQEKILNTTINTGRYDKIEMNMPLFVNGCCMEWDVIGRTKRNNRGVFYHLYEVKSHASKKQLAKAKQQLSNATRHFPHLQWKTNILTSEGIVRYHPGNYHGGLEDKINDEVLFMFENVDYRPRKSGRRYY